MEESIQLIEVQASLPKWCVRLWVYGPMETQSAADLRNLLAPGTENREANNDAQTVIMFLSFYLTCFLSPQANFKPL